MQEASLAKCTRKRSLIENHLVEVIVVALPAHAEAHQIINAPCQRSAHIGTGYGLEIGHGETQDAVGLQNPKPFRKHRLVLVPTKMFEYMACVDQFNGLVTNVGRQMINPANVINVGIRQYVNMIKPGYISFSATKMKLHTMILLSCGPRRVKKIQDRVIAK
jgi:hypothetical protein